MKKFVTFTSEIRVSTLVCSSIAVLLTACGGGDSSTSANAQPRTAGLVVSSSAGTVSEGQDTTAPQGDFAVTGYDKNPDAAPATQLASTVVSSSLVAPASSLTVPSTPYKLYVSPTGNDANAGTATAPFKTLARAARATRPGTTVFVAPGTYYGNLKTTISGTSTARIYYVSTTKWGAKIIPVSGSTVKTAWDNRGSYVDIIGFHVDGTNSKWTGGIYNGGSYDVIRGNWVHHIAKGTACNSGGGSAIGVDSYYHGVKSDVVGNLVHDIGPAGCTYTQGIYVSTSGTIKNNVVYRVSAAAIHLWHDANNVIITNNTVVASLVGIVVGGGDFYYTSGPSNYNRVNNNIAFDNKYGISEQGKTGTSNSYKNNLVYQNTYNWTLKNGLQHTGTVTSNPLFISYTRTGTPNLKPTISSPAVGRGTSLDALAYDFVDRPRNATTGYDIGAYQH